jgi:hypothetical protein
MTALEAGITPFVRVPAHGPEYVSRVLDGGALGVIAPDVRSAAQAQDVVAAAKYPPLGGRGLSTGLAHHRRVQKARQARRRRRPRLAARPGAAVREDGRPVRVDRHRPRLPSRSLHRTREAGARAQAVDVGDPALFRKILVDNPARLYDF